MIQKEFQNYFIHYRAWYLKVKDVLEKTGANNRFDSIMSCYIDHFVCGSTNNISKVINELKLAFSISSKASEIFKYLRIYL